MSVVGSPRNFHLNRCMGKERGKRTTTKRFCCRRRILASHPGGRNEETKSVSCVHHTPISRVGRSNKSYDLPSRCFCFHIYKHILFLYIYIIIDGDLEVTRVPRTMRRTHNIFIGIQLFFFFNGKIACVRKCVSRFLRTYLPTYLPLCSLQRQSKKTRLPIYNKLSCIHNMHFKVFLRNVPARW